MIEVIVNGQVCFNTKIGSDKHCWQVQHWPQCRSKREGNVTVVDFVLLMTSVYFFFISQVIRTSGQQVYHCKAGLEKLHWKVNHGSN